MNYRLAVLTHGRSEPLARCLESFYDHVSPAPASVSVYADGAARATDVSAAITSVFRDRPEKPSLAITHPFVQLGFCGATRNLWDDSVLATEEYVFWLEHDFVFKRPVSLHDLAYVLDVEPRLAQVALCRGPVNEAELAAGGLVASRPGEFKQRWTCRECPGNQAWWLDLDNRMLAWLEQRSFFTTNPSLMRRSFMAENRWPSYPSECEGRFGIDLVARGFSFGFWGTGEPWVDHIGVRDGFGY